MKSPFADFAEPLIAADYSPLPILPGTKRPALGEWQRLCNAQLSPDEIERFVRSPLAYGVGVALGFNGLIAIDIDTDDAAIVAAIRSAMPASIVAKRGRKGQTDFHRDPTEIIRARKVRGPAGMLVEILGPGNQTVIPPTSHPATGQPYRWTTERWLDNTRVTDLPVIPPDIADRMAVVLRPWLEKPPRPALVRSPARASDLSVQDREQHRRYAAAILARELTALGSMAPNSGRNDAAFRLVCRAGRWAHHSIIPHDQLVADVFGACERNGLVRDDGCKAVLATIDSGLAKSAGDTLPELGARHG